MTKKYEDLNYIQLMNIAEELLAIARKPRIGVNEVVLTIEDVPEPRS